MQNASIFVTFYKFDKCVFFLLLQILLNQYTKDIIKNNIWRETIFAVFFFTIIWPKTFCTSRWHFAIFKYKNTHGFTFVYCHQKNFFFYVFIAFKGKWCSSMFFHLFFCFVFLFFVFLQYSIRLMQQSRDGCTMVYDFCYYRSGYAAPCI